MTGGNKIPEAAFRLIVIGGGFTGAVCVIHALRTMSRPMDITVIEPSAELGRGIAYGTDDPVLRINVPVGSMAISSKDPTEATRWFQKQSLIPKTDIDGVTEHHYVSRYAYGTFISDLLRSNLAASTMPVTFRHLRNMATKVARRHGAWRVTVDDDASLDADLVAFCVGHPAPAAPCPIDAGIVGSPKFVAIPWSKNALTAIAPADSVLIVGTGLTMVDTVLSLKETGRGRHLTAISRHGLLPREHGLFLRDICLFEGKPLPSTALGLLRLLRHRIRNADPELGWQPFVDSLRFGLSEVWSALPENEQRRVLRHLLSIWDAHRFRMAPHAGAILRRIQEAGKLTLKKARLVRLAFEQGRYAATLRGPTGKLQRSLFDAVVLCTGPERSARANSLVTALLADGTVALDRLALGLSVDRSSRILDEEGRPVPGLVAFGPMTRGSFGEMTGAPDIAKHIERVFSDLFNMVPVS